MSQSISNHPIVAAVRLDASDASVLAAARYFARKLHTRIEVVHAVRPMFSYVGSGDIVLNPYYGYEMNFADREEKAAREKLAKLVQGLDDVEVSAHILRDFPYEAIMTIAHETQAALIVCGVQSELEKRGPSAVTTGFTLASESDIPVLLVPPKPLALGRPLRILIADNLEEEGQAALGTALHLANALHAEQLTHIHVRETSFEDIDRMIESVRESMILGNMPSDPQLNRDHYIEQVKTQTRDELIRRSQDTENPSLNATLYDPVMCFGHPAAEVHGEVMRTESQIMVFGRHHMLRRKTLSLGRIPYEAMIESGVGTLVVPDHTSRSSLAAQSLNENNSSIEAKLNSKIDRGPAPYLA